MKFIIKIFILLMAVSGLPYAAAAQNNIDLTWSASSEAPAGYRGKILPTQNSTIMISALTGSGNLIFNWFINNNLQSEKSGVGKSDLSFKINGFPGSDIEIRLEILTGDKKISLNKFVTIPVVWPQTFIYLTDKKTALPYGKTLKDLSIKSATIKSLDFVVDNYFFNFPKDQLKWNWLVNNKEITGVGDKPWSAVLNVPSGIALPFSFQIRATAKNPQDNLESAESTVNLEIK